MNRFAWGVCVLLWIMFTWWYTNTGGALTQDEVAKYLERYAESNPAGDLTPLRAFLENDTGRQFMMVNLLDMADDPPDVSGATPGESADALLGRYMEHMFPALFWRACHPVYVGDAIGSAMDLVGIEGAETWTRAALMRYRSRRDLMEIATNPAFAGRHQFKMAALEKTIAFPVENVIYAADPRLLLAFVLFSLCAGMELVTGWRSRSS